MNMMPRRMETIERARSALNFIDASCERGQWVKVGQAIHSEWPDDRGLSLWNEWSRPASNYASEKETRSVWGSFKQGGGHTIATLYGIARDAGWRDNGDYPQAPLLAPEEIERRRVEREELELMATEEKAREQADAAKRAKDIIDLANDSVAEHPYIRRKGGISFGRVKRGKWTQNGWENALLVPIYDETQTIVGIEAISESGEKRALKGCRRKNVIFPLQSFRHSDVVLVAEGLSTAAAGMDASAYPAVCAFGKGNLSGAAKIVKKVNPGATVIILADIGAEKYAHDAAAAVDGLWCAPVGLTSGNDFWDLWNQDGADTVERQIVACMKAGVRNELVVDTPVHEQQDLEPQLEPTQELAPEKEEVPQPAPEELADDISVEFPYIRPEDRGFTPQSQMGKLKASLRAGYLTGYYGAAYVSPDEARNIHVFNGAVWELKTSEELEYDAVAMLKASGVDFEPNEVTNIIKVMRQGNRRMELPSESIISFKNGVFDCEQKVFRYASPYDWQTTQNGIVWSDAVGGESLAAHAPNFHKWLSHAKYGCDSREDALLAALYMVLTCRYNWELAISLTGEGGAGKSVMQRICTMLSGEHNMAAIDIDGICGDFGLEHLLAKRLLIASEVAAKWPQKAIRIIKAITGGDFVMVNRKGEKVVSALVRAIMIFTGNVAFDFGSVDSGLQRRIVHFGFTQRVPDEMKDDQLTDKIADELPVVIRHLMQRFTNPEVAKKALLHQRDGSEASAVKYEGNPLERFLSSLEIDHGAELSARSGMQWNDGGKNGAGTIRFERQFIWHAYLSFCDNEALKPSVDMAGLRRAVKYRFGKDLKTGKGSQNRTLVNLRVIDDAEYLPHFNKKDDDQNNAVNLYPNTL